MVDRNRIWAGPEALLINDGGEAKKYQSIDDIRKEFGWEIHGKVQPYDPAKDTVESVAQEMGGSVGDVPHSLGQAQRRGQADAGQRPGPLPLARCTDSRSARGRCPRSSGASPTAITIPRCCGTVMGLLCSTSSGCPLAVVRSETSHSRPDRGYCWYVDAEPKYPDKVEDKMTGRKGQLQQWNMRVNYAGGKFWLVAKGSDPQKMLPQGVGYWSPCLGRCAGGEDHHLVEYARKGPGLDRKRLARCLAPVHERNRPEPHAGLPGRKGRPIDLQVSKATFIHSAS